MTNASSARRTKLDAFDRAILRIIQRDNKTPQRTIAEAVSIRTLVALDRVKAGTGVAIPEP